MLVCKYVYRGDGKRAWKELANGTRTYFYYMGEQLTASSDGVILSSLVLWGADGIVGYRNGNDATRVLSRFYNLYDPQGNLAQTLDANGNVISQSAVSAWGEPLRDANGNASGGGYGAKFGYIRDGESGVYPPRRSTPNAKTIAPPHSAINSKHNAATSEAMPACKKLNIGIGRVSPPGP